jgi:TolB protein
MAVGFGRVLPGGIVAYTYDTDGIADIYALDVARMYLLNLTRTPTHSEEHPSWSPNGAQLAYERNERGTSQLCILEIARQFQCFPPHGYFDNNPVWSPDGQWLASNSGGAEGGNLFLLDTTNGEVRRPNLITQEVHGAYSWSPDSTRLAFSEYRPDGYLELSILNLATGEVHRRFPDYRAIDLLPAWSPDGQRIALMSDTGLGYHVSIVSPEGGSPRPLTTETGYDLSLSWSPDGSKLLLVSNREADNFDLFLIDSESGDMQLLTDNTALDERPTWSPDGRQIAFTSDRDGGDIHIYIMNADGSNVRRLTFAAGRNTDPAWRP